MKSLNRKSERSGLGLFLRVASQIAVCLPAMALLLGCSAEPLAGRGRDASPASAEVAAVDVAGRADPEEIAPPQIVSLRLDPVRPKPNEPVRAVASLRRAEGAGIDLDYEWKWAGQTVRAHGDSVRFPASQKGDRIEVIATATDEWGRRSQATAFGRVGNRPPVLLGLDLSGGGEVGPGQAIEASLKAHDPDGDELRLLYDWRVNGRRSPVRESSLPTRGLRRGDEIQLSVSADDGDDRSAQLVSEIVRVGNSPPEIVSDPNNDSKEGSFFYQVRAQDRDHDRGLVYSLVRGPAGMSISRLGGELSWDPRPDQGGVHVVTVRVEDRHGGASTQTFELTISEQTDPQELAAALR